MTVILGLNAYHADASAAIFRDGQLIAAAEEERFSRVKHSAGFPVQAVKYCLETAGVRAQEVDHIGIPRKRTAHILQKALWGARMPGMAAGRAKTWQKFGEIKETLSRHMGVPTNELGAQLHFVEHHAAHVASSFYVSPFEEAAVLTLDGLGDFASMTWGTGKGNHLDLRGFVLFPHSLGFLYTAITQYLGFWKYGEEFKVMGLGAYGTPKYKEVFDRLVRTGRMDLSLDLRYFTHHRTPIQMTWSTGEPKQGALFSEELAAALGPAREGGDVEQRHMDIAASLQLRLEEVLFTLLNQLHERTGLRSLCYAGGVAMNCVANGQVFDRTPFRDIYIQPAAGDAGLAIGAALYVNHEVLGNMRTFLMNNAYLGPEYGPDRLKVALEAAALSYRCLDTPQLVAQTAKLIAEGKIVGWFQGRTEWGPRALGNRSIVADPRRHDMKDILNRRIKHREPFRPFSPSILEERTGDWFERDYPSPFMLMAYPVKPGKRESIPAPTHVDGTGRLQTVSKTANPIYWDLISAFEAETGVPVLLNTSFNDNEPIVNTPEQAVDCFLRTKMDVLVLGPYLVQANWQGAV